MDTNPGWHWSSPAVIVAVAAVLVSLTSAVAAWVGVWRAWQQARSSKRSADAAKDQLAQATNQATFANEARADAVRALDRSNKIATEMAERLAEANVIQAARTQVKYTVQATFSAAGAESTMTVRLHNSSPERSIVVRRIGLCSDRSGTGLLPLLGEETPWSQRNIDKDQQGTFTISAVSVASRYRFESLATASTLYVEFVDPNEPRCFDDTADVQRFAEMCGALAQWMGANRDAFKMPFGEWDFSGFEGYGRAFKLA